MKNKLTYFPICPFSRSIILLLDEFMVEYEKNEINDINLLISKYNQKNSFYPIFEEFSDKSEENDKKLDQSCLKISSFLAINEYIFTKYGKKYQYLYGENQLERIKINEAIWWLIQEFYQNSFKILIYEKYLKCFEEKILESSPDSKKVRIAELRLKEFLLITQAKIKKNGFCASESITYADFLFVSQVSILDYMNLITWNNELIDLKKWYLILKSRPNFKNILKLRIFGFKPNQNYFLIDF